MESKSVEQKATVRCSRDPADELPTTEQLATLAALLNRDGSMTPEVAAKAALDHWRAADKVLAPAVAVAVDERRKLERFVQSIAQTRPSPEHYRHMERREAALAAIRLPKTFPVRADKLAGLAVPRLLGRTGDAASAIRQWLCVLEFERRLEANENTDELLHPDKPTVDALFARWRKRSLSAFEFHHLAKDFAGWYSREHRQQISATRSRATKVRHDSQRKDTKVTA